MLNSRTTFVFCLKKSGFSGKDSLFLVHSCISFKTNFLLYLPAGGTKKPEILSEPQDFTVVSTSFSLLCIKSPGSTVTWYHNDKQVNTVRNTHIQVTSDGSILVKNALEGRDDGSYYCLVSNRKGAIISRTATVKFACK